MSKPHPQAARRPIVAASRALLACLLAVGALAAHALDLQGHRGIRGLAPENTLPSFELAIAHGVTTLELDAAITKDGVVVIHPDLDMNPDHTRDAAGRWLEKSSAPIHSLTFAELQGFDVGRLKPGTRYAAQFPEQKPLDGTRVPRLSDLFDLVKAKGHDKIRFAVELKVTPLWPEATQAPEPFATAVVAEIRKAGMAPRVQIMSFDWRTLAVVQRIAPEIPTVYLTAQQSWIDNIGAGKPGPSPWTGAVQHADHGSVPKMIKAAGGRFWSVYHGDLTADRLKEAQSLGLKVLVWTVNDPAAMGRFVDMGVDGLITDRADLAMKVLAGKGIRPE